MEDSKYSKMTVAQLKNECTNRGLDTTGKKADLVQRIVENQALEENGEGDAEEVMEIPDEEAEVIEDEEEEGEGNADAEEQEAEDGDDVEVIGEEAGEEAGEEVEEEEAEEGQDDEEEEGKEEGQGDASENVDEVIDAIDSYMEDESAANEGGDAEKKEEAGDADKAKKEEGEQLKKASSRPKIPIKKVVRTEYQSEQRVRTVVFGPLLTQDLKNEEMLEFVEQADQYFIRFNTEGSTGHAQLRMRTFEDAQALVEAMTENPFKEGLVIKQLGPDDGQNVDSILKGEPEKYQEKFDVRMLYVHNVPESATEEALRQLVPEALSACIPRDDKRNSKGYAFLEFESSEKMEAYYKTTPNLKFDGYLMTLHHIPANVYEQQQKYQSRGHQRTSSYSSNRGGARRHDQRGSFNQQRDRRSDRGKGGQQRFSSGGAGRSNWGGNVRPLLGNQPSNWGNQGNQGGSGGVDAVNLLMGLSQMLNNQQGSSGNQGYGNQGGFRQGGNYSGGRQGGGDQWNRKRRHDGGGQGGYSKMQRNDYGGGYQGGYKGGRRY